MKEWKIGDSNKAEKYILPMLGNIYSEIIKEGYYINTFIGDSTKNINDKILLLYKFNGNSFYLNFEKTLYNNKDYFESYSPNKYYTMFVFNVPEKHKENYKLFKQGKYSEFSEDYKKHIIKFHNLSNSDTIVDIIYKREKARLKLELDYNIIVPKNQEYESIYNNNFDIFNENLLHLLNNKTTEELKNIIYTDFSLKKNINEEV
jgi:hypothetical protein